MQEKKCFFNILLQPGLVFAAGQYKPENIRRKEERAGKSGKTRPPRKEEGRK